MLKNCNGCKRIDNWKCRTVIIEDPKFRTLHCPCFECILKVTCEIECRKQTEYIWRRLCITYARIIISTEKVKVRK